MARRLRIQFPGAIYHLINRGNYRRDLFATVGAAKAFECALGEASTRLTGSCTPFACCEIIITLWRRYFWSFCRTEFTMKFIEIT